MLPHGARRRIATHSGAATAHPVAVAWCAPVLRDETVTSVDQPCACRSAASLGGACTTQHTTTAARAAAAAALNGAHIPVLEGAQRQAAGICGAGDAAVDLDLAACPQVPCPTSEGVIAVSQALKSCQRLGRDQADGEVTRYAICPVRVGHATTDSRPPAGIWARTHTPLQYSATADDCVLSARSARTLRRRPRR